MVFRNLTIRCWNHLKELNTEEWFLLILLVVATLGYGVMVDWCNDVHDPPCIWIPFHFDAEIVISLSAKQCSRRFIDVAQRNKRSYIYIYINGERTLMSQQIFNYYWRITNRSWHLIFLFKVFHNPTMIKRGKL